MNIPTSSIQEPQVLFTPEEPGSAVRPASGIYCRTKAIPCNDGSSSIDKPDTLPPAGPDTERPAAPTAATLNGTAAEAGLALLDQIESLRDLLVCLSAAVRKPGTPDMMGTMHLVADATEALTAVECEARAMLAAGCGLRRTTPKTDLTFALGDIAGQWAANLLAG